MSGQFFAGCAAGGLIALAMILLAVWGANRGNGNIAKKNREANDLSAKLLRRRNKIGERQADAIDHIGNLIVTRELVIRRERIATAMASAAFQAHQSRYLIGEGDQRAAKIIIADAIWMADAMIAELDRKPEPARGDA